MKQSTEPFDSEADLTRVVSRLDPIKSAIERAHYHEYELEGLFGVPDLVTASVSEDGRIESVAFEMKLSKWRRALRQAFRYRGFARKSYVVMDDKYVGRATKYSEKFVEANIGLLSVNRNTEIVREHIEASSREPYSRRLSKSFRHIVWCKIQRKQVNNQIDDIVSRIKLDSQFPSISKFWWENPSDLALSRIRLTSV